MCCATVICILGRRAGCEEMIQGKIGATAPAPVANLRFLGPKVTGAQCFDCLLAGPIRTNARACNGLRATLAGSDCHMIR